METVLFLLLLLIWCALLARWSRPRILLLWGLCLTGAVLLLSSRLTTPLDLSF
ncbi:hypothetical protein ACFYYR_05435 [Streptomyces sp. NPDC001922]|uniref:hypothetical protein n=1 Tax=unclassified Streptomyces TaxID=2593676 RepID=UPI00332E90AF